MKIRRMILCAFCIILLLLSGARTEARAETERESVFTSSGDYSLLKYGSEGDLVLRMQERLAELGYDCGGADGAYGQGTRSAVIDFQRHNHLDPDGMAGEKTLRLLYSDDALPAPAPPEPTDVLATEWPILVNKVHPAEENLTPKDLVFLTDVCDPALVKIKYSKTRAVRRAAEALIVMLEAARNAGVRKWQVSAAFRTYQDQENLLNHKIRSYLEKNPNWSRARAQSAALRTVAEPGASEHHLGLCFDINVPGVSSFAGTKQCKWLHAHCWEYGFIVRYQKEKEEITGFSAEAWHIRYVGTEHAIRMRDENLCLEEYLEKYANEEIEYVNLDEEPEA